ncbi:hypothetical protein F0562_030543 [Nyssa sinensis]|uniref:non-specific serine/threonine protein kinase n=1 Tax=Nyssa sinensis TaxID=561372 RepID=A0A5J5AYU5_9ASTE|nr:hypothetical protein F0562_030543 [Nyssa sinensis]
MELLLGVLVVQSCMVCLAFSLSNLTDQSALLAIKNEIKIEPNNLLDSNWTTTTSFCNWVGVSCSRRRQKVTALNLSYMGLQGTISPHVGNLSFLVALDLRNNSFHGSLTNEIGRLGRLKVLILQDNKMEGVIPLTLFHCRKLEFLSLRCNTFNGGISEELGTLPELRILDLRSNNFMGTIPSSLGNLSTLRFFALQDNVISGSIPRTIFNISSFRVLGLTNNSISGSLPMDICQLCPRFEALHLSENLLGGQIPSLLSNCSELRISSLSFNKFEGSIPRDIGSLRKLELLYLNSNNFEGTLPPSLGNISSLLELAIAETYIRGQIPPELARLSNLRMLSFGDNNLTGIIPEQIFNISSLQKIYMGYNSLDGNLPTCFWLPNLELLDLGVNRLGGHIPSYLSNSSKLSGLFLAYNLFTGPVPTSLECKVLRNIRHRNLVKVISSCSNPELRALVLQYMSNGSLEKWLYSHNYCLDLFQRVSIMFDVALALEYLHHGQLEVVVHCDLKPNNVLLDEDMVAHVGDFGIAKIMAQNKTETQTKTLGTIGYIAPEYGSEGRVSMKGDIYSYGIMLLEMFTRKKPTDEMFTRELSLRQWVSASLSSKLMEVVDGGLFTTRGGMTTTQGIILAIMELGMEYCKESPNERCDIKEVVVKLNKTKMQLLQNQGD